MPPGLTPVKVWRHFGCGCWAHRGMLMNIPVMHRTVSHVILVGIIWPHMSMLLGLKNPALWHSVEKSDNSKVPPALTYHVNAYPLICTPSLLPSFSAVDSPAQHSSQNQGTSQNHAPLAMHLTLSSTEPLKLLNSTHCIPSWIHLGVQHACMVGESGTYPLLPGRSLTIQGAIFYHRTSQSWLQGKVTGARSK